VIQPGVLTTFALHQQLRPRDTEAGGQLFGRVVENQVWVELATGPRRTDIRSRYFYQPNRRAEQGEIDHYHLQGLLFLGDWHTHPEPSPTPSSRDLESIRETFKKSVHHLNGFLLVIVGTQSLPSGLYVAVHNDREAVRLLARSNAPSIPKPSQESASHGETSKKLD
jgi:integrative and conjugative element protein (TIGR02256 family)